jgi:hypothetical protein
MLLLAACLPAPTAQPTPGVSAVRLGAVTPNATEVERYGRLELTVELDAEYSNPFDPAQVDLWATFSGPGGATARVPGFYYQAFARGDGEQEQLAPVGAPAWKVRFTPDRAGEWSASVSVTTPAGGATARPVAFTVSESARQGFVRADPRSAAYLAFDSGAPYIAIGQNVGWYGPGGSGDYERWFAKLGANGANFARVWMASWAFGIEWADTGLGDYSARLDRAWQLDRVFELAEQHEIYIMLALLNHGAFSAEVNPEWGQNPYNAALGGPCAEPGCFASNPTARELFKRRLRYIVARWGHSPNLLAWEWWNEVDWTPMAAPENQTAWIAEMSAELAKYDPYRHLRTTSYGRVGDEAVWRMAEIDLVQRHVYETSDPIGGFARGTAAMRRFGKPALYGEFGFSASTTDASSGDRSGVHVHSGIWAGLMSGGLGGGMSWWWDSYIEPLGLERLYAGPAAFFAGEDPAGAGLQPAEAAVSNRDAAALALVGPGRALGWVKSDAFSYDDAQREVAKARYVANAEGRELPEDFVPDFPEIAGLTLRFAGLAPGEYLVEWWDTQAGVVLASEPVSATADGVELAVPPFTTDLAFKLIGQ